MYRDYANYKQHNKLVFLNPADMLAIEVERIIKDHLIDGEWFYANKWKVQDLHFKDWDNEIDSPVHEFVSIKETDETPNIDFSLDQFLTTIRNAMNTWII